MNTIIPKDSSQTHKENFDNIFYMNLKNQTKRRFTMKTSIFYSAALFVLLTLFSACSDNSLVPTGPSGTDNYNVSKPGHGELFWESKGFTLNAFGHEFVSDEIRSQTSLIGLNNIEVTFTTCDNTETEGYMYEIAILGDVNGVAKLSNNGQANNSYQMNLNMKNSSMIRIYAALTKTSFVYNPAAFLAIENVKVFRLD
jgi:hypothetical protein